MISRAGRDSSGDQTTLGARISIERSTDHHKISGGSSRKAVEYIPQSNGILACQCGEERESRVNSGGANARVA